MESLCGKTLKGNHLVMLSTACLMTIETLSRLKITNQFQLFTCQNICHVNIIKTCTAHIQWWSSHYYIISKQILNNYVKSKHAVLVKVGWVLIVTLEECEGWQLCIICDEARNRAEINSAKQSQRTSALCHQHTTAMQTSRSLSSCRCYLTANPLCLSHTGKMDHLKAHRGEVNLWIRIWHMRHSTSGMVVANNAFTVWARTQTNIDMQKRHILICGNSSQQAACEVAVMAKRLFRITTESKAF